MKRKFKAGLTSVSLPVFIADTSSTTGGGLSGVTSASSGLIMEYRRAGESTWTNLTPQSGKTLGSYLSRGIVADGSLAGAYEIDFPDAAFAAGVRMVVCRIRGVANMLPVLIEIELDAVDYQDAAAFGLSRLSDIETDTQNLQSRIPTALVDGRMTSVAQVVSDKTGFSLLPTTGLGNQTANFTGTLSGSVGSVTGAVGSVTSPVSVSDKTGFKLASDGLALVTAWTVGITGNITGNLSGSVGSISGVRFPANFSSMAINAGNGHVAVVVHSVQAGAYTSAAFSPNWFTADGLAIDAANEIATAVSGIQVLSRLDSMIEDNGSGQFRFDTIGLSMAPAGGGGGGTDWTADERTAIRTILGVPASGTTPTDPTSGILDTIRDSLPGTQTINVYPVSASTPERVAGTTITYYRNEIRSVSVVTDFTLTNLTLSFTIEDAEGTDLLTIANASITRSSQTFTVSIGTAVTASVGNKRWALRDLTGGTNSVIARGVFSVQEAASSG